MTDMPTTILDDSSIHSWHVGQDLTHNQLCTMTHADQVQHPDRASSLLEHLSVGASYRARPCQHRKKISALWYHCNMQYSIIKTSYFTLLMGTPSGFSCGAPRHGPRCRVTGLRGAKQIEVLAPLATAEPRSYHRPDRVTMQSGSGVDDGSKKAFNS